MNLDRWRISVLVTILLVIVEIGVSCAASVKASDLVTITTDVAVPKAPCSGSELPIRIVRNTDSTVSQLIIPEHQVLVLTSGSWRSIGGQPTPNRSFHLTLLRRTETTASSVFSGAGVLSDAEGELSGGFDLGSGIVMTGETTLCGVLDTSGMSDSVLAFVHINGYFAKDK
jgi:hypothetical protein